MSDFKRLSRSVKGLTVLVTGAASGMGRATALVFGADGANVAVTDISAEATQAVADAIAASGGAAKAWTLDVSDRHDITAVVDDVAAHFGEVSRPEPYFIPDSLSDEFVHLIGRMKPGKASA